MNETPRPLVCGCSESDVRSSAQECERFRCVGARAYPWIAADAIPPLAVSNPS
jgi:hypothetical protein